MPLGVINCKLRDYQDHFRITLYKEFRDKLSITFENILLLKVNGAEFIRIPIRDFHITIPKRLIKSNQTEASLEILKIWDKEDSKKREKIIFKNGTINLSSLIPPKTLYGNDIFVLEEGVDIYIWYSIGGGADHIRIKNNINLERLAELIGFYFGDGNTSYNIRSFRLNNCESSTLNYCIKVLGEMGIKKEILKLQIIYSTPRDKIDETVKSKCIDYWSGSLGLSKNQIVSVNRSNGKTESLLYGSARIFFDNAVFVELMLNGVLRKFVEFVRNPDTLEKKSILKGFLRGLAAAEGSVNLTKLKSLSKVGLSYNPHSEDLEFYKLILYNLGVEYAGTHGNELYIYKIKNFKIFKDIDLFKMHETRRDKFNLGYRNHKYYKDEIIGFS